MQQALGRQRYADELRAQMGEKQRRKDREKAEQKERQRREWEDEMQVLAVRREAERPGRRSRREIERTQAEGEEPGGLLGSPGGGGAYSRLEASPYLRSALKERAVGGGGAGAAAAVASKLSFLESPRGAGGGGGARLAPAESGASPAPRRAAPRLRVQSPPRRAALPAADPHMSPMARFAMGEQASPHRKPAEPAHGRRAAAPQAEVWGDPLDNSALTSLARLRKDLMVEYQMLGGRLQNLHGKAVFSGARARPPGGRVRPWEPGGVGPGATGRFAPAGATRKGDGGASAVWETQRSEWVFPSLTDGDFEDHDADWKAGAVAGGRRAP